MPSLHVLQDAVLCWLTVLGRVDGIALVLHNAALAVECPELPLHKVVVEGVGIGGDEAAAPVYPAPHALHVVDHGCWEVVQPLLGLPAGPWPVTLKTGLIMNITNGLISIAPSASQQPSEVQVSM